MVFTATSRTSIRDVDRRWMPKFIIRAAATVASIVAVGCIAWALAATVATHRVTDILYLTPWLFIGLVFSIVWSIANFISLLARSRPIHPGANVGCDLVIWLALVATGAVAVVSAWEYITYPAGYYNQSSSCYSQSGYRTYSNGTQYYYDACANRNACSGFDSCAQRDAIYGGVVHIAVVIVVGCAFTFLAGILHFVLFVWACRDTDIRNKTRTDRRAGVIAQEIITKMTEQGRLPPASQPLLLNGGAGPGTVSHVPSDSASAGQNDTGSADEPYVNSTINRVHHTGGVAR